MRICSGQSKGFSTFSDVVNRRAAEHPDDLAYTFLPDGEGQELTLSYLELERRAKAVAASLQAAGLAGQRAMLLYPPGLDFVSAMLGCLCAGVIAVPAYPPRASRSRANHRINAILKDARPAVVLTVARSAQTVTECLGEYAVRCLATDELEDALAEQWQDPQVTGEQIACLQYTSGSTASPKGVMLSHANLLHNSAVVCEAFAHTRDSRGVIWLPPYHDMGLAGGVLQPLYAGFPVVLMAPTVFLQRPVRWLRAISRYRATTSGGPNFAYDLCARTISEQDRATLDLSSWGIAFNGAEPIDPATIDRFVAAFGPCGFRREAFYPCYGLAESTLMVSGGPKGRGIVCGLPTSKAPDGRRGGPVVGCGRARLDGKILIVEPESRTACPPGVVGEIWAGGSSVARGYWNQPDATAQTFGGRLSDSNEGPFLRTGDLGFLRDGELFVTGRLKDLINIRGIKHYPQDIERTVQESHPALRPAGAAAFSVDADGREQLVVLQEVERTRRDADVEQVMAAIRGAVGEQHELEPGAIVLLRPGQIPKTSSGKVQRYACREGFLAGRFEVVAEWHAPQTAGNATPGPSDDACPTAQTLQDWLTHRLAATVGAEPSQIDPAESFARYGLDSVKAVSLAGQITDHTGCEVPATLFWDYPSISTMSAYLAGQLATAPAAH